jgi:hypothetical protein
MTAIKIKPLLLKLVKACSAIDKQASGVAAMKLQRKTGVKREDHLAVRSGKKCDYLLVPADLPNKLPNSNDGQAQQANNRCLSLNPFVTSATELESGQKAEKSALSGEVVKKCSRVRKNHFHRDCWAKEGTSSTPSSTITFVKQIQKGCCWLQYLNLEASTEAGTGTKSRKRRSECHLISFDA